MERARTVCKEMLAQRNLEIDEETDDILIAVGRSNNTQEEDDGKGTHINDPDVVCVNNRILVFFSDASKFNIDNMKQIFSVMTDREISHAIIVYQSTVTAQTRKYIELQKKFVIELFAQEDLQFNITKHRLQPSAFERLSDEEAVQFKKTYGVKFPVMKRFDPIARFFFFQPGDVIKITRKNSIVSYRIVR